ncbi:hypothetical protein HHK36_028478 [Tetracentron sinense]|uniref:Bet v I/Major latex protein domain-containing protein n=1 Tax=Tetracentron sinense TaxID=13715 RepID=A0A834YFG8_TETSI|nr:hypothetical protein HHK36_028478 [Tetracentron sinense]
MRGQVYNDLEVGASAEEVWAVYSSPELPRLIVELQPGVFEKIDIVQGNGRVDTVLHVVLAQGLPEPREWKEKFMKIDHKERTKVVRQIEGGYLGLGFRFYEIIFKIIAKDEHSCIIRSTTAFDIEESFEANASLINASSMWGMAKAISNYVMQKKESGCNK